MNDLDDPVIQNTYTEQEETITSLPTAQINFKLST